MGMIGMPQGRSIFSSTRFKTPPSTLRKFQFAEDFDKPQTTYRATVEVCVAGEKQMDQDELRKYLYKATKLCITQPSPNDETVQVQILWHDLQPVSERKGASDGQA